MTDAENTNIAADQLGRSDAFSVTLDTSMDVRDGEWDGQRSREELRLWATREDGSVDWAKAARGYAIFDLAPDDGGDPVQADGKLNVAYVVDGQLVAIGNGIRNALSRLPQVEPPLPEAIAAQAEAALRTLLDKLNAKSIADAPRRRPARGLSIPLTAAMLASSLDSARVYRMSRIDVHLDDRAAQAIARAVEIAERTAGRNDAVTVKSVADELIADGFDDYLSPEGFCADVWAARTGVQDYSNGLETWGEFRSLDEVGSPASLASWSLKAFTDDHPDELVTPENYRQYAVGSVGENACMVQGPDGQHYVKVKIFVGDIGTLRKIRDGKVELSAGYTVVPLDKAGIDPVSGRRYRFCQTAIRINHLALVDAGRAGPLARINIDSAWEVTAHEDTMTIDQLSPEQGAMALSSILSYLSPESPEAQTAALETAAGVFGVEASTIAEGLAPFVKMSEPEEMDLIVDIAEGLAVKMSPAQRAAWDAIQARRVDAAADIDRLQTALASRDAEVASLDRSIQRLTADLDMRERAALVAQIADVCPDLAASWRSLSDEKIVESCKPMELYTAADGSTVLEAPLAAMQRAAICDVDSGAAAAFEAAREVHGKNWSAHVQSSFDTTMRLQRARSRQPDPKPAQATGDGLTLNQRLSLVRTGQVAGR